MRPSQWKNGLVFIVCFAMVNSCQIPPSPTVPPTTVISIPTAPLPTADIPISGPPFANIFEACRIDEQAKALRAGQEVAWQNLGLSACYWIGLDLDETIQPLPAHEVLIYTNNTGSTLPDLVFRLYPNSKNNYNGQLLVHSVMVDQKPVKTEVFLEDQTAIRVPLDSPLPPGKTARIDMNFSPVFPKDFGAQTAYGIFNRSSAGPVYTMANWFPILAVRKNGQWQTSPVLIEGDAVTSESALFKVTISTPEKWKVVTSGTQLEENTQNGHTLRVFVSGPARDFMMVASPAFESKEVIHHGVKIRQWGLAITQSGWDTSLDFAVSALDYYDEKFGLYPFNELDIVADPLQNASGVEYPGLVLIINSAYQGRQFPGFLQVVLAHEIAHQWWYSVIGNDVLNAPWQDEGLTTYSTLAYLQQNARPIYNQFLNDYPKQVSETEKEFGEMGISTSLSAFQAKLPAYAPIVYEKSALFFNALRQQIGDEAFQKALQNYYQKNRFQLVPPQTLLKNFSDACSCDLSSLFQTWGAIPAIP